MGREYRMVEIHTTGVIERSAADVFAYVADYRRMNEWVITARERYSKAASTWDRRRSVRPQKSKDGNKTT